MTTTNTTPGPRTRPLLIAATIPSLLSLAWTAWSVADMIPAPAPIAIAAGIALDIMLVAAVAIAWTSPAAARSAQAVSWVIAALAATAIGVHSWEITPALVLLAPLPLVAKALWGLALSAKIAQEDEAARAAEEQARAQEQERLEADRKAARLSTELTEDQEAELADLERERTYVESKSARELALAEAEAQAAQEQRLAQIRRDAETQMATDEATAKIHVRRAELADQIRLATPVYTATEIGSGSQVPNDVSGITGPDGTGAVAGFGGVFSAQTRGASPASPAGLATPGSASPAASPGASPTAGALSGPQRLLAYVTEAGPEATVKGAAREMGVDPRTVRRYRDRLTQAGHDLTALGGER